RGEDSRAPWSHERRPAGAAGGARTGARFLMPRDKDFKRIVRRRMAGTGEPYSAARAALDPDAAARRREIARWLEALGDPERAAAALAALGALPAADRRRVAVGGLERPSWRVRRACCRLL